MVPELSSARYSTYTLPSRTIAAGLKVCSASQCAGAFRTGSRKVDSGRGVITGLPLAGRVKGPISHGRTLCAWAAAANTRAAKSTTFSFFIPDHPFLCGPYKSSELRLPAEEAAFGAGYRNHPRAA